MAYLKPPIFVRKVFNPLAMRTGMGGATTLVVARRSRPAPHRVPVITIEHDGALYVVSTRGESHWVQNTRAAKRLELERRGKTTAYKATEVAVGKRGPIIEAYRVKAGRAVTGYFKRLPEDKDHPTFRLEPEAS
jgi:hypothetical protein